MRFIHIWRHYKLDPAIKKQKDDTSFLLIAGFQNTAALAKYNWALQMQLTHLHWPKRGFGGIKRMWLGLSTCGKVALTSHRTHPKAQVLSSSLLVSPPTSTPSSGARESVGYHRSIRQISAGQAKQHIPQAPAMRATQPLSHTHTLKQHTKAERETVGWRATDGRPRGYLTTSFNPFFQLLICMSTSLYKCF